MKLLILLYALVCLIQQISAVGNRRLLCYYNVIREARPKLNINDLEPALQLCSHLIYGYASIDRNSNKLEADSDKLNLDENNVTNLKKKYPNLKVLLSVGGDSDEFDNSDNKYLTLLDSDKARVFFINSASSLLKTYNFDGLDIAWQFPKNKPKKEHSSVGSFWKKIKKTFTGDYVIDEKAEEHKQLFTALIRELKNSLDSKKYVLGLSVLPNVNSSLFYDVSAIVDKLDYVNLMAFDFQTPDRNPEVADFPAPIYELKDRNSESNINYQVQYWLKNHCPKDKINVGIAAYGRAWKMTRNSDLSGIPPVKQTDKAAPASKQTQVEGLLSYPEICDKLLSPSNQHLKGADSPLHKTDDPKKCCGNYAYRLPDNNNEHGMWVGYDDPETAGNKADYVKTQGLGGVALVDLSFDDVNGSCTGHKYPILSAINDKLQRI